jgi:glycerol-3-phosphate dehydrogenase
MDAHKTTSPMGLRDQMDLRDQKASFDALEKQPFDLLIIGAGITGCGIARDAAMRGYAVALIDAGDIGAGTSSRSSKLIHGGLRYMAQGDLMVVKEAATERRTLRRIAPHLALTNPMVVLAKSRASLAGLKTAIWSYEKLAGVGKDERHRIWDSGQIQSEESGVVSKGYAGAVVYPEYLTDDFRLTLANARSAAQYGAMVATYAKAESLIVENERVVGALIASTLPGFQNQARIRSRFVVNASGPWVDAVRKLEDPTCSNVIQLTKGIHIVLERKRLPIQNTIVMNAKDRRGIFAVPRGKFVYLGTTDTFYSAPDYWPQITREDIAYLFENVAPVFGSGNFSAKDVVSMWAGIRPLLGEKGKKPSEISRRNEIMEGPRGLITMAGGKLTAYRSMAQRVVDQCETELGRKPFHAATGEDPLPGGDFSGNVEDLVSRIQNRGIEPDEARRMVFLYGNEALSIFSEKSGVEAEVRHAVLNEGAVLLEDYWVRRSARARFDDNGGLDALEPASCHMKELMGWTEAQRIRQIQQCRQKRKMEMAVLNQSGENGE